jgi:hypothetical protein
MHRLHYQQRIRYCLICDIIQSEEACLVFDEEASLAALRATPETVDSSVACSTYKSGPFADDTICGIENLSDNTCTVTINETECNSCTVVECGFTTDFDIDCSNVIAGETWNLCTDDIPESSLFIGLGNNDRFQDLTCGDGGGVDLGTDECVFKSCDTLQGVEACLFDDEDAQLEAGAYYCFTYESGPFADSTICLIDDFFDINTCTITIDGNECNSCNVVTCSDMDGIGIYDESYDFDCSNIIVGETWNLCSDDIPETSPFIAAGNNMRFFEFSCVDPEDVNPEVGESDGSNPGNESLDNIDPEDVNPEVGESDGSNPGNESLDNKESGDGGDMSGGVAASSHMLSLVGLIIVACFW